MIHNAWTIVAGDHNDLRKQADIIEALSNTLSRGYAARSGKSIETVRADMDAESWYFGEEIRQEGYADTVIPATVGTNQAAVLSKAKGMFASMERRIKDNDRLDVAALSRELQTCSSLNGCRIDANWMRARAIEIARNTFQERRRQ